MRPVRFDREAVDAVAAQAGVHREHGVPRRVELDDEHVDVTHRLDRAEPEVGRRGERARHEDVAAGVDRELAAVWIEEHQIARRVELANTRGRRVEHVAARVRRHAGATGDVRLRDERAGSSRWTGRDRAGARARPEPCPAAERVSRRHLSADRVVFAVARIGATERETRARGDERPTHTCLLRWFLARKRECTRRAPVCPCNLSATTCTRSYSCARVRGNGALGRMLKRASCAGRRRGSSARARFMPTTVARPPTRAVTRAASL